MCECKTRSPVNDILLAKAYAPSIRKRLLALAAQKFVADIATDAYQYCKVRQSGSRKTGKVK